MQRLREWIVLATTVILACAATAGPEAYPDGHGGEVMFPMGEVSFADRVETYASGDPSPSDDHSVPEAALGVPDMAAHDNGGYLSLGCGGELVLGFEDNSLVDVAGPDLYVFEIGPDVEPTALAVSGDGREWVRVGKVSGGKAEIDLAPFVSEDAAFRYVKLVDLKSGCSAGETPGADIDAVGAIGSAQRISLDSAVLFNTGEYALKPEAFAAIDEVLSAIDQRAETSVVVAGHTDSVGSERDNEALSRNRAQAVADYLIEEAGFSESRVTLEAHGESRPVAGNDTAQGRAQNRRVELTVKMPRPDKAEDAADVEILGVWDARGHGILEFRRVDGALEGSYTSDGGQL
ncbi:MAG: OmpA family protein, partial [Gammaproteobacteria bacterium]|nr:OmpA family protein [Gammaproteobacteria bacterium]NIX87053.1 OmpA family protein [Gammaproteobacteria bacterium]